MAVHRRGAAALRAGAGRRMMRCRSLAFSLLALLFIAAGAQNPAYAQAGPQRVVTLGSDVTEIVYALGEERRLAGRDATSAYPADAARLPDVGYFRQLGAEGVLSLKPDLILATATAGPPEVLRQIASTGVKLVTMPEGYNPETLLKKYQTIAEALNAPDKGAALADRLKQEMAQATATVAALPGRPKVLFVISSGGGAPMAAGRDTAADAMIALAGGENVFAAHSGYKAVSLEASAAAAPEAIAMMEQTLQGLGGISGIAAHPALGLTPAAKERRIVARDGSFLLNFGPRLPAAIMDFAKAIRGSAKS